MTPVTVHFSEVIRRVTPNLPAAANVLFANDGGTRLFLSEADTRSVNNLRALSPNDHVFVEDVFSKEMFKVKAASCGAACRCAISAERVG